MLNKNERGIRIVEGKKYYSLQAITREFMNIRNTKFTHEFAYTLGILKVIDRHYGTKRNKDMWKEDPHWYSYTLNNNFKKFIVGQYIEDKRRFYLDEEAVEIVVQIYNRFKEEEVYVEEYEDFVIRNISLIKVRQENRA